jgi:hypothetical protein
MTCNLYHACPKPSGEADVGAAVIAPGTQLRGCWVAQQQALGPLPLVVDGLGREVPVRSLGEPAAHRATDPGETAALCQRNFDRSKQLRMSRFSMVGRFRRRRSAAARWASNG